MLERATPVCDGPSRCGERSFRRDQPFLYFSISLGTRCEKLVLIFQFTRFFENRFRYIEQEGLYHITVIVIKMIARSVTIHAIALIPCFMLLDGIVDPHRVVV